MQEAREIAVSSAPAFAGEGGQHDTAAGALRGFAIGTCCHHRCSWEHFTGRGLFRQLGFTGADFAAMARMSGRRTASHATTLLQPVLLGKLTRETYLCIGCRLGAVRAWLLAWQPWPGRIRG